MSSTCATSSTSATSGTSAMSSTSAASSASILSTPEALLHLSQEDSLLGKLLKAAPVTAVDELERRLARRQGPWPVDLLCADLFGAGGKRLRALVAFFVAEAEGLPTEVGLRIAEAVELTHGATLLHDDVIDEADTRRAQPAARRRFSNTLSVLGGDYLLLRSLKVVNDLGVPALGDAHRRAIDGLLGAEVAQHLAQRDRDLGVPNYLAIAGGKTGVLFAFACAGPALYAGDSLSASALAAFGEPFGVAFQILDDLRDLAHQDPGKPGGLDLQRGVLSLPLRLAAGEDPALAEAIFSPVPVSHGPGAQADLVARVRATGAMEEAARISRGQLQEAMDALRPVPFPLPALHQMGAWLGAALERAVSR